MQLGHSRWFPNKWLKPVRFLPPHFDAVGATDPILSVYFRICIIASLKRVHAFPLGSDGFCFSSV